MSDARIVMSMSKVLSACGQTTPVAQVERFRARCCNSQRTCHSRMKRSRTISKRTVGCSFSGRSTVYSQAMSCRKLHTVVTHRSGSGHSGTSVKPISQNRLPSCARGEGGGGGN
eukprot:scaffold12703_cov101-Isochrysis_galbana.AAC.3